MAAALSLLIVLLTSLSVLGELQSDCTGSLGLQLTNFDIPAVSKAAQQTVLIRSELQQYQQQVTAHLQKLEDSIKYLTKNSQCNLCSPIPTHSVVKQNEQQSSYAGEKRRLSCNWPEGDNKMLVGIHDDNQFTDLDSVKCVRYDFIRIQNEHHLSVPQHSNELVSCGPGAVVTGFGATDDWMEHVSRLVCRNITAGADVTGSCHDVTVQGEDGNGPTPPASDSWPSECHSSADEINVITGVVYNQRSSPSWQKLRCCRLKRTLP